MKIAIAGTGHVGLPNAILFAQHNEVVAIDIVAGKRIASPLFAVIARRQSRRGKPAAFINMPLATIPKN